MGLSAGMVPLRTIPFHSICAMEKQWERGVQDKQMTSDLSLKNIAIAYHVKLEGAMAFRRVEG